MGMASDVKLRKVLALMKRDGAACWYCHIPLTIVNATLDHKHPKSKGGSDKLKNLVLACRGCNIAKGDTAYAVPYWPPFYQEN